MVQRLVEKTRPAVQLPADARSKGERTRDRILDIAQDAIIHKGFAATSIEELVEAAGITKSGFFYHFRDKNDLARQLFERFMDEDNAILDTLTARARTLSEDPLQSLLIFLNLYAETMDDMPELHPGCLVAAITYQEQMFDREVRAMNRESILGLRARFREWLAEIERTHAPRIATDFDALADQLTTVVEGSIVLSKALADQRLMGRQMRLFRDHVKLIFGA
ncbi:TetR/AcrR family transcriptional regulator [Sphingomonas sp. ID1715]|uniref:TetR/AcrR family transcriptional regulator n=1 Tax=Sphingomonas sp. ID1715 TaxID=1656898 RepID=UPI001489E46E|nr:TetR/AcrR family transcriptional regulator [Sphingomonas sp. ID1715]NNM78239.1 TetR/AcrR family transcriptional regulator [Sphingomonas sp. ID1715]